MNIPCLVLHGRRKNFPFRSSFFEEINECCETSQKFLHNQGFDQSLVDLNS